MKLKSLIMFSAAALAFAACSNDEEVKMGASDSTAKTISVSISGNLTRAAMTPDAPYAEEAAIDKLDIYFTDAAGNIVDSYSASSSENQTQFEALMDSKAVRFIGLEGVSGVYIVANDANAVKESGNVDDIVAELKAYNATKSETEIAYVGGDISLDPGTEPYDPTVSTDVTLPGAGTEGVEYVYAKVAIRPVISRLEISKIGVQTSGVSDPVELNGKKYFVTWSGFNPTIVGMYMSNVYPTVTPVTAAVGTGFSTPSAAGAIKAGVWTTDGSSFLNTQGVGAYSNYNIGTSSYDALFAGEATTEDNVSYAFTGSNTCVPFNFLVPFEVTSENTTAGDLAAASTMAMQPQFHVQLLKPSTGWNYNPKVYEDTNNNGSYDAGTDTEVTDESVKAALTIDYIYPTVTVDGENGTAFANFSLNNEAGNGVETVKPATIYKMEDLVINPFNVTATTKYEKTKNVIVNVTPVDYGTLTVTPSFDKK